MEINGIVLWLLKWWLILSGIFWALVATLYFLAYYFAHHRAPS